MPNMDDLRTVHEEIYQSLIEDYGSEKVEHVNNLGEQITFAIIRGYDIEVEPWVKEIVMEFQARIINHPLSGIRMN